MSEISFERSETHGVSEGKTLSEIIETEIRTAGAEGKISPTDVLRDFNTGFDSSFSQGVGMRLENTVGDVLEKSVPLNTRATNIDATNRAAQNMMDFIRTAIQERMKKQE